MDRKFKTVGHPQDLANNVDLGSLRQHRSRGWHSCTLCGEYTEHTATSERAGITYRLGHAEIRAVSDDGVLYVAPNLIIHYIVDHLYGPPADPELHIPPLQSAAP
ncbi:DUF7919 family protein [Streptomyces sp. NPDC001178]